MGPDRFSRIFASTSCSQETNVSGKFMICWQAFRALTIPLFYASNQVQAEIRRGIANWKLRSYGVETQPLVDSCVWCNRNCWHVAEAKKVVGGEP